MTELAGKVVIITGAGSGIGRATARLFGTAGAKLVLVGRRVDPLSSLVQEIESSNGNAVACPADLEDGDAAAAVAEFTLRTFGRINILINNAGHSSRVCSIRWVEPDDWQAVFRVNVDAVYRLTQASLPDMLNRGDGTVITIASMAALHPGGVGGAPYSAAKAAVCNMMQGLSIELRAAGIRATTIIPGETNTPILEGRSMVPSREARKAMMQPEDVAQAILFCASMPSRTLVDQMILTPAKPRDMRAELEATRAQPSTGSDTA